MDITEKLKANFSRLAAIKEEVERAKAEKKAQDKKEPNRKPA